MPSSIGVETSSWMDSAMPWAEAVVLGTVQGIAEFLPISSSGHLAVCQVLFNQYGSPGKNESANDLAMNVALHLGTLVSILIVYRRDVLSLLAKPRLCAMVVLATIPAAVVGLTLKKRIEASMQQPVVVALCWYVTAAMLTLGQRWGRETSDTDHMTFSQALTVGLFQAVALLPGISRSGSTITGGLVSGLRRESAAKFSFLIAIPAIGGAAVLEGKDLVFAALKLASGSQTSETAALESLHFGPMLLGAVVAGIVGWFALTALLQLLNRGKLHWFAIYCTVIATATLIWQFSIARS